MIVDNYQAEISSLQSVTSDSTRLLTEKLSLVRELSCLKPEMEHLKSQAVANRHLLSEKLALQRQLSTIQVELETEKRSIQRALAKEGQQKAEDAKLETQIESLQNDLLQERRQRERAEREAQKAQTDWDNKRATLESRLDAFRNKLRITKEQLKDAQVELKNSHTHTHEPPHHSAAISGRNDFSEVSRKRKTHLGDASTIGTPGISPMLKKGKSAATLPGDKSVFSITPFLNRASSVALETHDEPDGKDHDEDPRASCDPLNDQEGEAQSSSLIAIDSNGGFKEHGKVVRKRKLGSSGAFPTRSHKTIASLEKLNEREEENDNIKLTVPPLITADSSLPLAAISIENPGTKRRKRNLLGQGLDKSIFEGDEEETNNDNRKIGGKPDIAVRKRNFTLLKPDSRITSNSSATGFGAISPLKRKIKTIN